MNNISLSNLNYSVLPWQGEVDANSENLEKSSNPNGLICTRSRSISTTTNNKENLNHSNTREKETCTTEILSETHKISSPKTQFSKWISITNGGKEENQTKSNGCYRLTSRMFKKRSNTRRILLFVTFLEQILLSLL